MARTVIALLRGINVGRANRIPMAALKELAGSLGFAGARTLLNSGNLVFTAARGSAAQAGERLRQAIRDTMGLEVPVIALEPDELARIVAANPFGKIAANPSRLFVSVLADRDDLAKVEQVLAEDWGVEKIAPVDERALYTWLPAGVITSRLNAAMSKALKNGVTARNIATMTKLLALARGSG